MKIICVGMNYSKHNKELGCALLKPESPVIFMKPDSSILRNRRPFFLPDHLGRVDYETELVVRINQQQNWINILMKNEFDYQKNNYQKY